MDRRQFSTAVAGMGLMLLGSGGWAQGNYPSRTVTMVNPFPAGSPVDVVARELASQLANYWGQSVIVESRSGAGGTVGANSVARSQPDGYTLLLTSASTHAIAPAVRRQLPYDALADFTPIAFIGYGPAVIVTHPSLGVETLDEFLTLARQKPGEITYASSGVGTILHLSTEVFSQRTGVELMHVPYQGAVPAATDLLGGHVDMMADSIANAAPNIRAGRLKALMVVMPERSPLLPDVPTAAELGYPDMAVPAWFGLFGPAGLPAEAVSRIGEAVDAVVARSDETQRRLTELGILPDVMLGDEFRSKLESDIATMKDVVAKAGIPPLD